MDVLSLVLVMSFLNLTATTKYFEGDEHQDVVDPSGWNYDRVSKGSQTGDRKTDKEILTCEQKLSQCKTDIAYWQHRGVAAAPGTLEQMNISTDTSNNSTSIFIRRFVSLLLESASLFETSSLSGDIEIRVSATQLKILRDFSSSHLDVTLRELDSILTDVIHKKPRNEGMSWKDMFYVIFSQKEVWLYMMIFCILWTICRQISSVQTVSGFVRIMLFVFFIISYLIEYYRMYKHVEIRQMVYLKKHPDVPESCDPRNQHWMTTLFDSTIGLYVFKKDNCEEYYKELWSEPLMEVSPLCVLSSILADFILYPAEKLGKAVVVFSSVVLGELPLQWGWFIYIISSVGLFVLLSISLLILIGGTVRLRGLLGGIEVSRRTSLASPSASAPAVQAAQPSPHSAHPLLDAVGKTGSLVLMDTNALQNILRGNLTMHRNLMEEIAPGPSESLPLPNASQKQKPSEGSGTAQASSPSEMTKESKDLKDVKKTDFNNAVEETNNTSPSSDIENNSTVDLLHSPLPCEAFKPLTAEDVGLKSSAGEDREIVVSC